MRDVTERVEGIEAGTCKLVGTRKDAVIEETIRLLGEKESYEKMAAAIDPYGDGKSSDKILNAIKSLFN